MKPSEMSTEQLEYIRNLRHILGLLRTANNAAETLKPIDIQAEQNVIELSQDIVKAIQALENELSRSKYNIKV